VLRHDPAAGTVARDFDDVLVAGYQRVFCTCRVWVWLRPSESVVV